MGHLTKIGNLNKEKVSFIVEALKAQHRSSLYFTVQEHSLPSTDFLKIASQRKKGQLPGKT